ncbi:hypothetical protein NT04LM_0628, partial [Listeria monocytogenes FSL F2-208]
IAVNPNDKVSQMAQYHIFYTYLASFGKIRSLLS